MELKPYKDLEQRHKKTMRHYYSKEERWWALSDQPREAWRSDWWALRELLDGIDGWTLVEAGSEEDAVLKNGHGHWLSTSERACEEARDRQQVFCNEEAPNRTIYVGRGGITVVVATEGDERYMVTAFRVVEESDDPDDALDFEACERKAVRKYGRYSSYLSNEENS